QKKRILVILEQLRILREPTVHRVTGLVRQRIDVGENVFLVIHEDVRRSSVSAGRKCTTAFAFVFVAIAPATRVQAVCEYTDVFLPQRSERGQNGFDGLLERKARVDFGSERNVGVVLMQLGQAKNAPSQIEVPEQRLQICVN